ncbi:MAG: NAD-dependent epimerase/dehydratase family protein [Verrucomicrobia bacterium]|nr:NAD-dependent epimerase/dehydratase family protein [Verrucomicrobiota bacterium]
MKVLITGICGFAGTSIANTMVQSHSNLQIFGLDNFSRKGSELNISELTDLGIDLIRGDARVQSDLDSMPTVDWVIDCAANPSVLAGLDGQVSSRQVMEHNLLGTINLLEYCKKHGAGLILLSTSRVYSAKALAQLPVHKKGDGFQLEKDYSETGISFKGIAEGFPTTAPISLYGASKLASEALILEYAEAFDFPVFINRCGVLAGAGQFGKADQGIFSYWIHSFREKKSLKYVGFGGSGFQVRDALHPRDLAPLLIRQMEEPEKNAPRILNLGGGPENATSLHKLSAWCEERFGPNEVSSTPDERPYDAPWIVMDSSMAREVWDWSPKTGLEEILKEIAGHAEKNPNWLTFCMS